MGNFVEFLTSAEYVAGIASSLTVAVLAYLVRPKLDKVRGALSQRSETLRGARQLQRNTLVREARRSERVLLGQVLGEMRARLRAHTWLLLSFFTSSLSAFVLFFYIEMESALAVPTAVSLGLVGVMMGAIVLFVFSLSDEKTASLHAEVILEILDEELESEERSSSAVLSRRIGQDAADGPSLEDIESQIQESRGLEDDA
jgi:hypothetical protein